MEDRRKSLRYRFGKNMNQPPFESLNELEEIAISTLVELKTQKRIETQYSQFPIQNNPNCGDLYRRRRVKNYCPYIDRRRVISIDEASGCLYLSELVDEKKVEAKFYRLSTVFADYSRNFYNLKQCPPQNTKLGSFISQFRHYASRKKANIFEETEESRRKRHLQSEHNRRDSINHAIEAISELVPNCDLSSKRDILTDAIIYLMNIENHLLEEELKKRKFN